LEQYNILVQNCAQVVAQCQQQLEEARASGDPGRIAEAEAVLTQALVNYETAVAQQQEAVNNALGG
ncbi:MAG: hypothetical protein J6I56_03650, partial [Lachnospiraceae bacterium]|nr:hypothetical protein [Lachnospiraceae bacterium]